MYGIRKRHLTAIILFLSLVVIAFSGNPVVSGIKSNIYFIFKTPVLLADKLSFTLRNYFVPKGIFLKQIRDMDIKIKAIESENAQVRELSSENQRLKSILSFKKDIMFKAVAAEVIARDPSNWRHTIIIDKGASSGIKKNSFVISQQGLIGRICEAGSSVSKAILLTDPDFRVAGICQRSREQMIVSGDARSFCNLKYLSQDADIQPRDIIVSSGLGGFCPKGILIGEVAAARKSSGGIMRDVYVKPAADLNKLEEVLVLIE